MKLISKTEAVHTVHAAMVDRLSSLQVTIDVRPDDYVKELNTLFALLHLARDLTQLKDYPDAVNR